MSIVLPKNIGYSPYQARGSANLEVLVSIGFPLLFFVVVFAAAALSSLAEDCQRFEQPEEQRQCERQAKQPKGPLSGLALKGL